MINVITTEKGIKDLAEKMKGVSIIGYDLEFSPLNPHDNSKLFLVSITFGGTAYVIDYTKVQNLQPILPYLTSNKVLKIGHNITIDIKHTYHHLGVKMRKVYCTMIAEQVITAGLDVEEIEYVDHSGKKKRSAFSLAALLWRYFNIELDKQTRNIFINYDGSPFTQSAYEYAGKDTLYLERIYNEQQKAITEKELDRVINLEMRLVPYVADMEYQGVHFDIERCVSGIPVTESIIKRMDRWLQDMCISSGIATDITFDGEAYTAVKFTSWQQTLKAFNAMGINVEKTDKDALKEWDFEHGVKWNKQYKQESQWIFDDDQTEDFDIAYVCTMLRHYQVIKALDKFKGTYLEGLRDKYHAPTGKIYPSFLQCGARATGRFSSQAPNFQNLIKPKSLKAVGLGEYDIRSMLYAPKGYKLVQLDYEGIELVLLAILSGDKDLQASILSDDAHKVVTASIARSFGFKELPEGYKSKQPFETFRECAKTKTYARIYGSRAKNLYKKLAIPIAIAGYKLERKYVQSWFDEWAEAFPLASHALEQSAQDAVTKGYVTTVLGRRRQWDTTQFTDKMKYWGAMREGANSRIQGSAADLMKLAIVRAVERLDPEQAWLCMQVHDEIVFLAREEYAEECGAVAHHEMVRSGTILFGDVANGLVKTEPMILDKYKK